MKTMDTEKGGLTSKGIWGAVITIVSAVLLLCGVQDAVYGALAGGVLSLIGRNEAVDYIQWQNPFAIRRIKMEIDNERTTEDHTEST